MYFERRDNPTGSALMFLRTQANTPPCHGGVHTASVQSQCDLILIINKWSAAIHCITEWVLDFYELGTTEINKYINK